MTDAETGFVRAVNDAVLPATRHTRDDALMKRGTPYTRGATNEGLRRLTLHARVLKEAVHQRPEIAEVRIRALYDVPLAELIALGDLETSYRLARAVAR